MKQVILSAILLLSFSNVLAINNSDSTTFSKNNTYKRPLFTSINQSYSYSLIERGGFCFRPAVGYNTSLTLLYGAGKNIQPYIELGSWFHTGSNWGWYGLNGLIGGKVRIGGEKTAFSVCLATGGLTDFSNISHVIDLGAMIEIFKLDAKIGTYMLRGDYAYTYINIGYNFRSEKFRRTIASEQESTREKVSHKSDNYNRSSVYSTQCPAHKKTAIYSEASLKYSIDMANDGITGIYESVYSNGYKLGVIKYGNTYCIVYLSGGSNNCWEFGHIKAELIPTATTGLFKANWYMSNFSQNSSCVVTFDGATMKVILPSGDETYLKMYPSQNSSSQEKAEKWSGSGWCLSSDGYIVTNNHVIDGASTIYIKGIGGDLNTGYSAEVVATDKINDIAVLKIIDPHFYGFGAIPYAISSRIADKGESIFVLGYPMTHVLGNEVKYTAGEINSRTGFKGDMATYQISAPVTHGNSGGPMFDGEGNVIGIINSGITNKEIAENVGYAIKISYLKILVESAGLNIKLPNKNTVSNLSKQEMVKRIEKYVYYIECKK